MSSGYRVERNRIKKHSKELDEQRERWATDIPSSLHDLYTNGDEFTIAGNGVVSALEGLRQRYANELVPGIAELFGEVSVALQWVAKNYGDAEAASVVATQGSRIPTHQVSGDIGDILRNSVR